MRDLGLAREQALGDDAAHAAERNAGLGHPGDRGREDGCDGGCTRCGWCWTTDRGILHVKGDDAAARAGALESREADAAGVGDLAGERGGLHANSLVEITSSSTSAECGGAGTGGEGATAGNRGTGGGSVSGGSSGLGPRGFFTSLLAILEDKGDGGTDNNLTTLGNVDIGENAFLKGLHLHGGFVGLDLGEDVTHLDLVTLLLAPAQEGALRHGVAQFGHRDLGHGSKRLVLKN